MPLISELLQRLPLVKNVQMSSSGFSLWLCWEGELDVAVSKTLQDYGGMSVSIDRNQSLWFFFSSDIFLALAKLSVWSKFNALSVGIQVFSSKLLLGIQREMSLEIDPSLSLQEILVPLTLEIWVHPKAKELAGIIPGITYVHATRHQGMAPCNWETIEVDARLPYISSQGWYFILRPIGNPLDKAFQAGWRIVYEHIEKILQVHKFKYYLHDNYLMMIIDNLRVFRLWIQDLLQCFSVLKSQEEYWPCVCVAVDKKGLNFTKELPSKVGIKWDNLIPDFPYLSYRNAFLLGDSFRITDLNFSSSHMSMDSWCSVALIEGNSVFSEITPVLIPEVFISGEGQGCFYCYSKKHESIQCPSRTIKIEEHNVWEKLSEFTVEQINEGFQIIEKIFINEGFLSGCEEIFKRANTIEEKILQAIFECSAPIQIRTIKKIWMATGRDFPDDMDFHSIHYETAKEESTAWGFLERFSNIETADLNVFEKDVLSTSSRSPRDFRLKTILGFIAVEKGELGRAELLWKEAETLASVTIHQAWHIFLQARILEIQTRFSEAISTYQNAARLCSSWIEPEYRQIICRIKMGFAEQVQPKIFQLIEQYPIFFNRFFIDPELERGSLIIVRELYSRLMETKRQAEDEKQRAEKIFTDIDTWFTRDHKIINSFRETLQDAMAQMSMNTYGAFLHMIQIRPIIEKDISVQVKHETKELKELFVVYLKQLEKIRDEAAWFPLPEFLVSFNKDFNECASIFNWAFASNFHEPEVFKQARGYLSIVRDLLDKLKQQLKFLRLARDASLFMLIFIKSFFWIEIIGLFLGVVSIPALTIFGEDLGLTNLANFIKEEQWSLQKVLIFIITVVSLGLAAIHATLVFGRRKKKLIAQAKTQREQIQEIRLSRIKEQKKNKED